MYWNETQSWDRIKKRDIKVNEIKVSNLKKEIDFNNLGSNEVRRAFGIHIYADIPNFHYAVEEAGNDLQKQKKLIRAASVLRKIQKDILKELDIQELQLQTTRLHSLLYKPYDDNKERSTRALIAAITLNTYIYEVFNKVFSDVMNFYSSIGMASGQSLIANIGQKGNRELISIGTCANEGAKIINGRGRITITEEIYNNLENEIQKLFLKSQKNSITIYSAHGLKWKDNPVLSKYLNFNFNIERYEKLTIDYRNSLPLESINVTGAKELIDLEALTENNNKRIISVSFFADLDGFTKFVEGAEDDGKIKDLVRFFHAVRAEFQSVIENDYSGIVLQHKGDCVFGFNHLPPEKEDDAGRCNKALNIFIGLQSSMKILNEYFKDLSNIKLAVGADSGMTILTRLGKKGSRENVSLGPSTENAEKLQSQSKENEIRISEKIYDLIDDDIIKEYFEKSSSNSYVASNLTFMEIDEKKFKKASLEKKLNAEIEESGVKLTYPSKASDLCKHVNSSAWFSRGK